MEALHDSCDRSAERRTCSIGHLERECAGGAGPVRAPAIAISVATEGAARYERNVVMAQGLSSPGFCCTLLIWLTCVLLVAGLGETAAACALEVYKDDWSLDVFED